MCLWVTARRISARSRVAELAALWRLPIVYVIVNNGLGHGHPGGEGGRGTGPVQAGLLLPDPGERVDGDDVLAVRDAARDALQARRTERQPG